MPSDGSLSSLRSVLRTLDDAALDPAHLAVDTPDLDDVFLALTGRPDRHDRGDLMTSLTYALGDSTTMLRRNLRRAVRYPALTVIVAAMPVVFLLLFVFVFGGTLGAGLGGAAGGRAEYVNFVTPGILIIGIASAAQGTAIAVAMDMNEGIIARFRTMSIARGSVLTGHVLSSLIQTMVGPRDRPRRWRCSSDSAPTRPSSNGSRPSASSRWPPSPSSGCRSRWASRPRASRPPATLPMLLVLLPFFGSGFVPDRVDARRAARVRRAPAVHAGHRTPCADSCSAAAIGTSGLLAVAWCAGITAVGYVWARRSYERRPARQP